MFAVGYGLTETNGSIASASGDEFQARPDAVGTISPLADVEIGDDGVLTVTIVRDHDLPLRPHTGPLYAEVKAHADADPDAPARFVLRRSPLRTFLARTAEIPPLGWQTFEPAPLDVAPVTAVEEDGTITISNGLVTVALPLAGPDAGTWSVDGTP